MNKPSFARRLGTITAVAVSIVATIAFALAPATVGAATLDPLIDQQWGLSDIGAPQVWNQSTGVGVTVAIIDGGSGPHPDLDANLNAGQAIINGIESDEGKRYFELTKTLHPHFICRSCHAISCLNPTPITSIHGYQVDSIIYKGICPKCSV